MTCSDVSSREIFELKAPERRKAYTVTNSCQVATRTCHHCYTRNSFEGIIGKKVNFGYCRPPFKTYRVVTRFTINSDNTRQNIYSALDSHLGILAKHLKENSLQFRSNAFSAGCTKLGVKMITITVYDVGLIPRSNR